jgi:hypothetical protein
MEKGMQREQAPRTLRSQHMQTIRRIDSFQEMLNLLQGKNNDAA